MPAAGHAQGARAAGLARRRRTARAQACEPKCTDAYKAYLSCVDRIEAKGGGATRRRSSRPGSRTPRAHPWASRVVARRRGRPTSGAAGGRRADRISRPHLHHPPKKAHRMNNHGPPRAGDCEPYYFDWLKCLDKCAMPHIMQKLK